ncbi:undecaprenyl pyrophosphate synthase [Candidatus Filomicrobium marinum]|uniref:Isoprenyl transferase n=2 Tax=Filomicrobium TaxID=119044 RepID=A0A0D6JII1_9HYPH|nr:MULTISPECIES: isoprenyl transferase [Filomicrobium]CFX41524.1 undecaprenyl pyrophosphate synthase [Candidatus Filomicrobium marinum]CPR21186.1 undecaprenyl pyrophosphate synthase [Candidatus Filomicrobium marinum]SDP24872.1 undecaprenyl diphosphate synthase [Filomicrobium insigne]
MADLSQTPRTPPLGPQAPRHVAVIMDGNGRWAKKRGLPRSIGHREGVEAVRRTVQAAIELSIPYLTIYSFSSENWSRPAEEIDELMGLMKRFIRRDLAELHQANVRILVIGDREGVDPELLSLVDETTDLTSTNTGLTLVIAFNYGARNEIARAARHLATEVAEGRLSLESIDVDAISQALDTSGVPDPDLLIRTSGEQRLSNFLLWQAAYTEFVFLDCLWPDFGRDQLEEAIAKYHVRDRRYGGLSRRSTA